MKEAVHDIWQILSATGGQDRMLFGSCAMLCLFLAVYACIKDRRQIRNLWLLAAGLIICLKANGILLAAIIALSLSDWLLSLFMAKTGHVAMRKAAYIYSLLCNIGMVAWFKSTTGFTAQFMPGYDAAAGIALPLGISFYLFHSVGYMTDVYKRRIAPAGRWTDYLLYLSFFPAIFAGPVMRAGRMLPQIASGTKATEANVFAGLWLVMLGLVKKMVFADYLAQFNNQVFAAPAHYSGMENTAALAGYGMQIYFDFSGYSDIAIGVAMMLGFDIGVNFDHPYRATSLTRFWHKWHISLSTWMRDYIYIPLGGNRHGSLRTKANLLLTMIVAGVWHGFTPLFLLWGAGHGIALIVQKQASAFARGTDRLAKTRRFLSWAATFAFVTLMWIPFRSESAESAAAMAGSILSGFTLSDMAAFVSARPAWCLLLALSFALQFMPDRFMQAAKRSFTEAPLIIKIIIAIAVTQLLLQSGDADISPFIYSGF